MAPPDDLPVREGYSAWSSCYDDDGNPLIALEGPAVQAWFGPLEGRRALDLGCGTGRHTLALAEAGASVVALDFCPEMMARARAKLSGRDVAWILHALPERMPLAVSSFDLAVLGLVAEHIAELHDALVDVARVLKPGGRCILSALHPDRTAAGQRARFIDPDTGERRPIATIHRSIQDYLEAAAGLSLLGEHTLVATEALAEQLPRASRYVGLPLAWVACWQKLDGTHCVRSTATRTIRDVPDEKSPSAPDARTKDSRAP